MTSRTPAWYAQRGGRAADLVTLLHIPYTAWHLGYVAIGAALAPAIDGRILIGTLVAFAVGLGVAAHALDELNDRPLRTALSDGQLLGLAVAGFIVVGGLAVAGAVLVSPWILVWAAAGILISAAYSLEWIPALHTLVGFGLAWGAFPVLAGAWAQTQSFSAASLGVAAACTLVSMAQRALSTPARFVRRRTDEASVRFDPGTPGWDGEALLATWEVALRLLGWGVVALAIGLLLTHI
jgi:hypothetical protein